MLLWVACYVVLEALWFAPMNQATVCFSYGASSMCPDLLVAQLATFEIDKLCTKRFVSAVMKIMLWIFWASSGVKSAPRTCAFEMRSTISNERARVTEPFKPHQPSNDDSLQFRLEKG